MKTGIIFLALTLCTLYSNAQNKFKRNDVYTELAGNGFWLSINYERQLTHKPGLGMRIALGNFASNKSFKPCIPIGINYLFKLNNKSGFIDLGLGGTWSEPFKGNIINKSTTLPTDNVTNTTSNYAAHYIPSLGYRWHLRDIVMIRTNIMRIITKEDSYTYFGLSAGVRF